MSKGVIIHLDNDLKGILTPSKNLFDQLGLDLEYIICQSKKEFDEELAKSENSLKCLVFDLISSNPTSEEINNHDPEFLDYVKNSFAKFNIPIFIYSGYLDALNNEFSGYGTVYKIDKGDGGFPLVIEKIKLLYESGFIDVFCPGGTLESEIKNELHESFINQFSDSNQIEEVLKTIKPSENNDKEYVNRVNTVFKRIAVKSLATDLLAPIADSEDKVNPIEHFYKRQSKLPIWTGDIWQNRKGENIYILVLTPRCDFATGKAENLTYCIIEKAPQINLKFKPEKLRKDISNYLTDNIQGKSKRYIPSTVFFPSGGMANLASHFTISVKEFLENFEYVITLSDDLANEMIGKFAYYFLRTGITNIDETEFQEAIKAIDVSNGQK